MNERPCEEPRDGVKIVKSMSKRDFHERFIRGVCRTEAFSALVTFWAESISEEEKQEVRSALAEAGIPPEMTGSDDDLNTIAAAVAVRSVRVM